MQKPRGTYSPFCEHDACGIGAVVSIEGVATHKTVDDALKIVEKLEHRASHKGEVVRKYAWLGLFILVAIPLPGTGAWTGALVAAMLNMRLKYAFPAISLGVVAAGLIMTLLSFGASHLLG